MPRGETHLRKRKLAIQLIRTTEGTRLLSIASGRTAKVRLNNSDCIFKGGKRSTNTTHNNTTRERDSMVPVPRRGENSNKRRDSGCKDKINVMNVRGFLDKA